MKLEERKKLIAQIVERFGVRLDVDDPAFIIVELNNLIFESRLNNLINQLDEAGAEINLKTTKSIDDFILANNEILSKYTLLTKEIKNTLETTSIKIEPTTKEASISFKLVYAFLIAAFCFGISVGVIIMSILHNT